MRKVIAANSAGSMGFMLTIAIAMANGSAAASPCEKKRVLRNVADASVTKTPEKIGFC